MPKNKEQQNNRLSKRGRSKTTGVSKIYFTCTKSSPLHCVKHLHTEFDLITACAFRFFILFYFFIFFFIFLFFFFLNTGKTCGKIYTYIFKENTIECLFDVFV